MCDEISVILKAEAEKLEAENEVLRKEVMKLKQQLILEEIRNGGQETSLAIKILDPFLYTHSS